MRLAKREERQRLRQEKCGEMKGFLLEKREEIKLRWRSEAANSAENGKAEAVQDVQIEAAVKAEAGEQTSAETVENGQAEAAKDMQEEPAKAAGDLEKEPAKAAKDMEEGQTEAVGDLEDKETGQTKEIRDGGIKIMDAAKIVPLEKK